MSFTKWVMLASVLPMSGCSILDDLARGLGSLAAQAEGQPDMYIARQASVGGLTRYSIDWITVVRGREDAPVDVFYEGWHRDFQRVKDARFPGRFTELSLRNDGARLAGLLEEDIGDTVEYYALLYTAPGGRELLEVTDGAVARDIFELCFGAALLENDLDRYLRDEEYIDPDENYEVTWDYLESGGRLGEWYTEFRGWTQDGDAVFTADVNYDAVVTVGSQTISGLVLYDVVPSRVRFGFEAVYSADTGRPIACHDGTPFVDPEEPISAYGHRRFRPPSGSASYHQMAGHLLYTITPAVCLRCDFFLRAKSMSSSCPNVRNVQNVCLSCLPSFVAT